MRYDAVEERIKRGRRKLFTALMRQRRAVRFEGFTHRRNKLIQQSNIGILIKYYRHNYQLDFKLQNDACVLPNQNIIHGSHFESGGLRDLSEGDGEEEIYLIK
jgi:hypothetical protein